MKIKNLCQNQSANSCAQMALELHDIDIEWITSGPADILICDSYLAYDVIKNYPAELKLCFDLQHVTNDKYRGWTNVGWISNKDSTEFAVIECADVGLQNERILFYDFLWNRSKAYYTNKTWKTSNLWYYHSPDAFVLQSISNADQKTRKFLSPNKLTRLDIVYRARLADVVRRSDIEQLGYYSAFQFNSDSTEGLYPNRKTPGALKISDINPNVSKDFYGYDPVHNAYYNETFFSVYVETIETGTTQCVTEKTLDPLIKGHFILPFSSAGFIKYLKNQGWRFPDFIDYRYDSISDNKLRFKIFKEELLRLCSISMDDWRQLWLDNIDIIEYNRNQLYNRPYHYLEVLKNGNST